MPHPFQCKPLQWLFTDFSTLCTINIRNLYNKAKKLYCNSFFTI